MEKLWRFCEFYENPIPKILKKWEKNWDKKVEKLGFEKVEKSRVRKIPRKTRDFLGQSQFFPRNLVSI